MCRHCVCLHWVVQANDPGAFQFLLEPVPGHVFLGSTVCASTLPPCVRIVAPLEGGLSFRRLQEA